jgi:hypothetical protein
VKPVENRLNALATITIAPTTRRPGSSDAAQARVVDAGTRLMKPPGEADHGQRGAVPRRREAQA